MDTLLGWFLFMLCVMQISTLNALSSPQVSVSEARVIIVLAPDENADQVSVFFYPPLPFWG